MSYVCMFPGQGSQIPGMGADLFEAHEVARDVYERADEALGYSLSEICFSGLPEKLADTAVQQPAILVTSMAALRVLEEGGKLSPSEAGATCGLSLGEYSALIFARAISLEDAVRLVGRRGELMEEAARKREGGMLSVLGLDREGVEEICRDASRSDTLVVANLNCPGQVVISGGAAAIDRAEVMSLERGANRAVRLRVSGAFHSPLMAPAQEGLSRALAEVTVSEPATPFLSNVTGAFEKDGGRIKELLVKQLGSPVLWHQCMDALLVDGATRFFEVGPGNVLRNLLRRIDSTAVCRSVGTAEAIGELP